MAFIESTTLSCAPRALIRLSALACLSVSRACHSRNSLVTDLTLLVGRNGVNMQDTWSQRPRHYLSLAAGPEFPNYFIIGGPNSAVGSGSLLVLFERVVDYIVLAMQKMQRENIRAMSIKQGAVDDFMEYVDAYFPKTVYSQKCRSWYKAGKELGPVIGLWPGESQLASSVRECVAHDAV